jgi:hypothetical protein
LYCCKQTNNAGAIQYFTTGTGAHVFYATNSEKMRISSDGTITANGDKLNFPSILNQYKINWNIHSWFGIAGTLQYSSQGNHSFYNSRNNANTFNIDSVGNVSCSGTTLTVGKPAGVSFINITDIVGAAWQLATGGYNLSFNNNLYGSYTTKMTFTNAEKCWCW